MVVEESRGIVICFVQNWGRKGKVDIYLFYNLRRERKEKIYFKQGRWQLVVGSWKRKKNKQKQRTARKLLLEEMEENKKVVELGKQ